MTRLRDASPLVALLASFPLVGCGDGTVAPTVREILEQHVSEGAVVGAQYRIVCRGRLVETGSVGRIRIEGDEPVREDTVFGLASGTKPFLATLVMTLVSQGLLELEEPVSRWIPLFDDLRLADGPPARSPTLEELLRHEGGLLGLKRQHEAQVSAVADVGLPLAERVERIAEQPLEHPPGTEYLYSPAGYVVLCRVVEVATGSSMEEVFQESLARPLGMTSSTFHPPPERLAIGGYTTRRGSGSDPRMERLGTEHQRSVGTLFCTAGDATRLLELVIDEGLLGDRVLVGQDELRAMLGDSELGPDYGLGWMVGKERSGGLPEQVGHSGRLGLSRTLLFLDRPTRSCFAILWTAVHPSEVSLGIRLRAVEVLERRGVVIEERWK